MLEQVASYKFIKQHIDAMQHNNYDHNKIMMHSLDGLKAKCNAGDFCELRTAKTKKIIIM